MSKSGSVPVSVEVWSSRRRTGRSPRSPPAARDAVDPARQAALVAAQALARKVTAPATLCAYKTDWRHCQLNRLQ
jgi:hypothetical protein